MQISRIRNIILSLTGILILFLAFLYSDQVMVGFSEFAFLSGADQVNTITFDITGGFTTGFTVFVENKEQTAMTYKLDFVDGAITNDSLAKKTCLSPGENQTFGQYITGDTSPFTLAAGESGTKVISVTFPTSYSGLYHGCVTLNAITSDMDGYANTLPTRGIFLDARVYSNLFPFTIKARPSNREPHNRANKGFVKVYDLNKNFVASSTEITLNSEGEGTGEINVPPGTYYVVFKGQSHLASYLSGETLTALGSDSLDFTTGSNLYDAQNLSSISDDGYKYQTAGDLKNIAGVYDYVVNGNDISIILYHTFPQNVGVDVLNPLNLNGDSVINASDLSVIGSNFMKDDAFAEEGGIFIWQ